MKHVIDQALSLYHAWLTQCPREVEPAELLKTAVRFHPNLLSLTDSLGRGIVHNVASFGPEWTLEHLLTAKGIKLSPDFENGWNPAHRAAYFGNVLALRLLYHSHHHLFDLTDHSGFTPVDILVSQSHHVPRISSYQKRPVVSEQVGGTLQTWGQNQNYTCGAESESARRYPEKIAITMAKEVKHASFSKYHGVCLTDDNSVYSWGINQNGRLGYDGPTVQLKPKSIDFNCLQLAYVNSEFKVKHFSTSDNHSVFLGKCGRVLGTGSNEHNQLGLGSEVKFAPKPKMLCLSKKDFKRGTVDFRLCSSGNVHTVLATESSLFAAGRNIGQFGSEIAKEFEFFTKLASIDQIGKIQKLVSSSGAIAVYATRGESGDIWLLENGETRKVLKVKDLVEMSLIGGRVHRSADVEWRSAPPVMALLTTNKILLWERSINHRLGRQIEFTDPPPVFFPLSSLSLFENGEKLIVAAADGQCYFGRVSNRTRKQWSKSELDHINRRAAEDPFSVGGYLKKKMNEEQNLYDKDITFSLERIPGAARCNKVFAESSGRTFGLLTLMNQKCIDIEDEVDTHLKPDQVEGTSINQDLYRLSQSGIGCDLWVNSCFQVHRQIFQNSHPEVKDSLTLDGSHTEVEEKIEKAYSEVDVLTFEPDVTLVCIDGTVECSKLVLMARSEYFSMMLGFGAQWRETKDSEVELDLFVAEVTSMVAFCQTGELPESVELISQLSIIADRFLMPTLSGLCQQELSRILVRERCPKAAVKAFPFSLTYNSTYLSRKCVQIIADHLAVLLETGYLDLLDSSDLEQMSTLYQQRIDLDAIRMKPEIDELTFDKSFFDEMATAAVMNRRRHKSEKSPPKDTRKIEKVQKDDEPEKEQKIEPEKNEKPKPINRRPKKLSLSEFEESREKSTPSTPSRPNWTNSPKTPNNVRSLNEIIQEQGEKSGEQKERKANWGPNRRKQAKGQDILRWEEEQTIENAKKSPKSPWGNATPAQRTKPVWPQPKLPQTPKNQTKTTKEIPLSSKTWAPVGSVSLSAIMAAEEETRKVEKSLKSLATIEIEERAIVELKKFYEMQFPTDRIQVTRVK